MKAPAPPNPWIAVLLSFFIPGLGHLYCGRKGAGLFWGWVYLSLFFAEAHYFAFYPVAYILGMALLTLTWAAIIVSSAFTAKRAAMASPPPPRLKLQMLIVFAIALFGGRMGLAQFQTTTVFRMGDPSLAPTLLEGDVVQFKIVRKPTQEVKKGDIVAVSDPKSPQGVSIIRLPSDPSNFVTAETIVGSALYVLYSAHPNSGFNKSRFGLRLDVEKP